MRHIGVWSLIPWIVTIKVYVPGDRDIVGRLPSRWLQVQEQGIHDRNSIDVGTQLGETTIAFLDISSHCFFHMLGLAQWVYTLMVFGGYLVATVCLRHLSVQTTSDLHFETFSAVVAPSNLRFIHPSGCSYIDGRQVNGNANQLDR